MKTKSPLLIAIGALALFVLIAFPSSTALASCGTPDDVNVYYEYDGPTGVQVEMEVEYPTSGAILYYTLNGSTNPTHDSLGNPGANTYIYGSPIPVPVRQWMHFRCRAWKPGIPCFYDSANITYLDISNPVQ
jgi:Chitobiase/beta-hexosaminidase C-terminal domain